MKVFKSNRFTRLTHGWVTLCTNQRLMPEVIKSYIYSTVDLTR